MSRTYQVLPECHGDTLLIDLIGFKNPNHQPSIGAVANAMKDNFTNRLAIGVIDDDKKKPNYFEEFEMQKTKDNIIQKKLPNKKHYIIILQPALEEWVFNAAENLGIEPSKYGIKNMRYFKKLTKNRNVHTNEKVIQFLNAIKQKKGSPMQTLYSWIDNILN